MYLRTFINTIASRYKVSWSYLCPFQKSVADELGNKSSSKQTAEAVEKATSSDVLVNNGAEEADDELDVLYRRFEAAAEASSTPHTSS